MTKTEIIKAIAREQKLSPTEVARVVNSFIDITSLCLVTGEEVKLRDFGKFHLSEYQPRNRRIPHTGENVEVPGSTAVRFKASVVLRRRVNGEG